MNLLPSPYPENYVGKYHPPIITNKEETEETEPVTIATPEPVTIATRSQANRATRVPPIPTKPPKKMGEFKKTVLITLAVTGAVWGYFQYDRMTFLEKAVLAGRNYTSPVNTWNAIHRLW
jgi:hypothetical protein